MRLSSVEVIPYALPFKEPYITARGALQQREMALLRVRGEDGVVGLGEAVPLSLRGGVGLAEVVRELDGWAEHREVDGLSAPARCAVETALMDLRGRRIGKAANEGERDEAVPCNATLSAGPPEEVAAQAERWAEDGFTTFKLKLGAETAKTRVEQGFLRSRAQDVSQVRAVREALGAGVRI
ncbi:MAG TPA: enolase C-terminal domain-like protein, partial [Solirubrobacterales bacterium]